MRSGCLQVDSGLTPKRHGEATFGYLCSLCYARPLQGRRRHKGGPQDVWAEGMEGVRLYLPSGFGCLVVVVPISPTLNLEKVTSTGPCF